MNKKLIISSPIIALGVILLGNVIPNIKVELKPSATAESMAKPPEPNPSEAVEDQLSDTSAQLSETQTESLPEVNIQPSPKALAICAEDILFEALETIDYELVVCNQSGGSTPSILHKYDRLTGSTVTIPLEDMQVNEPTGLYQYVASNSDFSYAIQASGDRELGAFVVRQGIVELVREPIVHRTLIPQSSGDRSAQG